MGYALLGGGTANHSGADQADERRNAERSITVFRPALIRIGEFRSLCLVRNVSSRGFMAKVYSPILAGTPIEVEFGAGISAAGTVAWAKERQIGVKFDGRIDVAAILTETGKRGPGNTVNRPLRLEIDAQGEMEHGGRVLAFEIQDISQRGLKAKISVTLRVSDEVMIRVAGLDQRRAVVRWTRAGEVGLNFTRPLGMDELAAWVVSQQTG